jgi:hypothetical protein
VNGRGQARNLAQRISPGHGLGVSQAHGVTRSSPNLAGALAALSVSDRRITMTRAQPWRKAPTAATRTVIVLKPAPAAQPPSRSATPRIRTDPPPPDPAPPGAFLVARRVCATHGTGPPLQPQGSLCDGAPPLTLDVSAAPRAGKRQAEPAPLGARRTPTTPPRRGLRLCPVFRTCGGMGVGGRAALECGTWHCATMRINA